MRNSLCVNYLFLCFFLLMTACSESSNQKKIKDIEIIENWNLSSIEVGNLDFGIVDFDKQKLLKVEIINDGSEDILTPLSIESTDFQLVVNTCQSLLVGEKCYAKISFNAKGKTGNSFTGNLNLGSHVNVLSAQINRAGEILNSVFINNGLPVSSYNFGNIEYNHILLKSFFVKNTGTLSQTDNASITGTDFSLIYDACSGKNLKPQSVCLMKVLISGQGKAGLVSGNLNYGDKNIPLSVSVKTQAEVAEENSEFVFIYDNQTQTGPINLDTINLNSFREYKIYVKNIGTRAGKVLNASYANEFDIFYNGCENKTLNPNQSCLLRAYLSSPTKGVFSTTLSSNVEYQTNTQSVQWTVREPGDKIDCSQNIANSQVAEITWTGTAYTNCELISCNSGHYLTENSCIPQICTPNSNNLCSTGVVGEDGNQMCDSQGLTLSSCSYSSCSSGYMRNQANTQCVLAEATGGDLIQTIGDYKIHSFTSTGTNNFVITAANASTSVEYLIVGGGGSGGPLGGGGAGGFRTGTIPNLTAGSHQVIVGSGGTGGQIGHGISGNSSSLYGVTSLGGGGGAGEVLQGLPGGSGGGGNKYGIASGSGTALQGNNGGFGSQLLNPHEHLSGGGGGGAGSAGLSASGGYFAGNGGTGLQSSISGTSQFYAAGGGGGSYVNVNTGLIGVIGIGGSSIGGNGGTEFVGNATSGVPNTGSGGGGGGYTRAGNLMPGGSGAGGSGIVIIKYKFK